MLSKKIFIVTICGILNSALSSQNSGIKYSHESESNDKIETLIVPKIHERVKRDVIAESKSTSTTQASKIYMDSPEDGGLSEDFLRKEVFLNKTSSEEKLKSHLKNEESDDDGFSFENDTLHKYYSHTIQQDQDYFIDLDYHNVSGPNAGRVQEHPMLSQSYRRAATINLSFKFPFYGHQVENITIATGGFLYTGDYVHSWLAATQYIAPLMANFDTSTTHNAKIRYLDDREKLIVEWRDVFLQDKSKHDGPFTFQVILFQNGNITFAYRAIPIDIKIITDEDHPVKVGLSDAYIIDRTVYFARRKTIYEYHRMNLKNKKITNKTAIMFKPLPTCNTNTNCNSCLLSSDYDYYEDDYFDSPGKKLECRWCPAVNRCSDGTDRNRQEWVHNKCDQYNVSSVGYCSAAGHRTYGYPGEHHQDLEDSIHQQISKHADLSIDQEGGQQQHLHTGSIVVSVFIVVLVISFCGWLGYAYFNPNTDSGRFLIKYRPGAWRWRQSGARYTAASIHM